MQCLPSSWSTHTHTQTTHRAAVLLRDRLGQRSILIRTHTQPRAHSKALQSVRNTTTAKEASHTPSSRVNLQLLRETHTQNHQNKYKKNILINKVECCNQMIKYDKEKLKYNKIIIKIHLKTNLINKPK